MLIAPPQLETNNLLNLPGVLITSVGTEIHVHENIKRVFGLADEPPVEDDEDTEMAEEPSPPSSAGSVSVEDDLRRAGFSRDYEWRKVRSSLISPPTPPCRPRFFCCLLLLFFSYLWFIQLKSLRCC